MVRWQQIALLTTLTTQILTAPAVYGQETPSDSVEAELAKSVNKWATQTVGRLSLENSSADNRTLKLKEGSLLRWSNPIIGRVYGDSYLWTDRNRPTAFLSIYAKFDSAVGNRRLTFQSLSADKLIAKLDDTTIWEPQLPGIKFTKLDDVRAPSKRQNIQRLQVARIVRAFSGEIAETDNDDRFRQLRLLTSALYQYESPENHVTHGSLFAFVDGTDPELLLMVEARMVDDELAWHFAPIRQNHRRLKLKRDDETIWDVPALAPPFPNPKISDSKGVYYNAKWSTISGE